MDHIEFKNRFISARRSVIERNFMHLNDSQREAVLTTSGPLLLLAGAGSGKTTVLINRVANILKYGCGSDSDFVPENFTEEHLGILEGYLTTVKSSGDSSCAPVTSEKLSEVNRLCAVDPVEPWRIIAITFTNKAAGEMKARLSKMLGPTAEDIWASTFHSACVRILRRDIEKLGYDRSFAIYDTTDSASLIKRILKELDIDEKTFSPKTVLGYISRAKDAMISGTDFLTSAQSSGDVRRKVIGRAYLEYENRMKSSNSLDFDDLILMTVRLFDEHPDVLKYYQRRFKHVLIDEYQDTNNLQYRLTSALAGGYGNICVVGDDDQSIYKFRGATIENILNFEKQFKDARVIRLEQNYRSTGLILNAAHDVIKNNLGRKGKKLWTESGPGDIPESHSVSDERAEAQFVADKIISNTASGRKFSEHAVLYRMNAQSNQFENAFKRNGIPYRMFGGTGFFERAEIKDMLAYLCVIHNPNDDTRLLRIINNPPRGIGNTTIGRIAEIASEENKSIYEILGQSQHYESLSGAFGKLHLFRNMIEDLRETAQSKPLDELYEALLNATGYVKVLEQKNQDENISRIENVLELKTNIISFMNDTGGTLFDFLSEIALFTELDRDDVDTDRVMMMTMHSAKGLEFDTVFIVGSEEGIFPGARAIGESAEMEEERRLCYVAMTRAMRRLYFTAAQRRMLFGKTTSALPSRFVREIGSDHLEIHEPQSSFSDYDFDFSGGFGKSSYHTESWGNNNTFRSNSSPTNSGNARNSFSAPPAPTPAATKAPANFDPNDTVKHVAFGRGVVVSISPAGGDALLEIEFDDVGTKRMLLKSAARYMTKVDQ
ncbi:MAG: UvrD-helicase domain-containing protein [Oscillospiraceae bacterium]|nr:UvrD-helicase domain-containing protein [Oscillospiraceae bacterium]